MAQEGIATLPQAPENQASPGQTMSFSEDLNGIKAELANQNPESITQYDQGMEAAIQGIDVPVEELQALLQGIEYILKNEKEYPQIRQQLISGGVADEEDLPEQFDRGYFMTMLVVTQEAINRKQGSGGISTMGSMPTMPQPLQGFARGGLASAAESLRQKGRYGDTVLAHINPQEAMMLKAMGGSGTINPATGLPEFFLKKAFKAVGNAFKSVGNAVKSVVSSPIGKIVATVALTAALGPIGLGLATPLAAGLAGASISLAGGSDLKSALISGVTSGAMAGLAPGISDMLPGAGGYLNAAATGAILGGGYGLATGQNLRQIGMSALTGGALAGGMSYAQGAGAYGRGAEGQGGVFSRETSAPVNDFSQNVSLQPDGTYGPNVAMPDSYSVGEYANNIASQSNTLLPGQVPVNAPAPATSTFDRSMSNASQFGTDMGSSAGQPTFSSTAPTSAGSGAAAGAPKSGFMDYVPDFFKTSTGSLSVPATTAAVLGIGALTGGFDQQTPSSPGLVERDAQGNVITGQDLIEQNPDKYIYRPDITTGPANPYDQNTSTTFGDPRQTPYNSFMAPPMGGRTPSGISSTLPQPYNTADMYDFMRPRRAFAEGGITQAYPRRTGGISGPGTGTSDDIPAMLSDGEFVLTAKAVRGAGKGSRREGAKKLYRMMHALEKKAK